MFSNHKLESKINEWIIVARRCENNGKDKQCKDGYCPNPFRVFCLYEFVADNDKYWHREK